MRHVSFRGLTQPVHVLPYAMENLGLIRASVDAASSLEGFAPSNDCADGPRAVPPASVTFAAHNVCGAAQLTVEQSP